MDRNEIIQKEQEYYKQIREGIRDITRHELGRWFIIVVSILLIWLGSWMVFRYLKDTAGFAQPTFEKEKEEVHTDG